MLAEFYKRKGFRQQSELYRSLSMLKFTGQPILKISSMKCLPIFGSTILTYPYQTVMCNIHTQLQAGCHTAICNRSVR